MTVSFAQLCEQIRQDRLSGVLMNAGEDRATDAVRAGLDLRDKNETSFWDEFQQLCSNTAGLAELLGVGQEKIRGWPGKIREMISKIEKQEKENPRKKPDVNVIPTGDNGAFTTNADPRPGAFR